uniref:Uncharacterized protein n=1 Tax=Octopus bimaculoides TaxID=37653 RepID=A0A0L8GDD0_OCTBM
MLKTYTSKVIMIFSALDIFQIYSLGAPIQNTSDLYYSTKTQKFFSSCLLNSS